MVDISARYSQPSIQQITTSHAVVQPSNSLITTIASPVHIDIRIRNQMTDKSFNLLRNGLNFSHWGFVTIPSLVSRDIWDGSDEFEQCIKTVCENVSIPLGILCQPNGTRHRDQSQQWTCEFCWPNQAKNGPAIQSHCLKVGYRSALMLHIVMGLLLGCITMSLLVWAFILFCKNPRKVMKEQETVESSKPQESARLKAKNSSNKRPKKIDGLVPIMPPARPLPPTEQSFHQVDGTSNDIELGLGPESLLRAMRIATPAVSSSIERGTETVTSRRSSGGCDVAPTQNHEQRTRGEPNHLSRDTES